MVRKSLIGQGHPRLDGGKVPDWPRLCRMTRGQYLIEKGGVWLSRSDTQLEYSDLVNGTAFPQSSEGNQLT